MSSKKFTWIFAMTVVAGCGVAEAPSSQSNPAVANPTIEDSHGPVPGECYCGEYEDWDLDEDPLLHLCVRAQWCFDKNPTEPARVDWEWDRGCTGNYLPMWGGPMHNEGPVDDFEVPGSEWSGWDDDGEWVIYNTDASGNLLACVSVDRPPPAETPQRQCFPLKPGACQKT
jgi:hypothetical protein